MIGRSFTGLCVGRRQRRNDCLMGRLIDAISPLCVKYNLSFGLPTNRIWRIVFIFDQQKTTEEASSKVGSLHEAQQEAHQDAHPNNKIHKRFVSSEGSLVQELDGLKRKQA